MRLVGCLLLPTDIRACLYEPGMGEGRIQPWIQPWARSWQAHHSRQPTRPLVMRKPGHIVHSHSLIWQHRHFILVQNSSRTHTFQNSNKSSISHSTSPKQKQPARESRCSFQARLSVIKQTILFSRPIVYRDSYSQGKSHAQPPT